jgi:hypothetical protein
MGSKITKYIIRPLIAALALLLIPLLFRWPWNSSDFVIGGVLIFVTGLAYEIITRNVSNTRRKVIIGAVILFVFVLVWAELAVGLFGTPFAGN